MMRPAPGPCPDTGRRAQSASRCKQPAAGGRDSSTTRRGSVPNATQPSPQAGSEPRHSSGCPRLPGPASPAATSRTARDHRGRIQQRRPPGRDVRRASARPDRIRIRRSRPRTPRSQRTGCRRSGRSSRHQALRAGQRATLYGLALHRGDWPPPERSSQYQPQWVRPVQLIVAVTQTNGVGTASIRRAGNRITSRDAASAQCTSSAPHGGASGKFGKQRGHVIRPGSFLSQAVHWPPPPQPGQERPSGRGVNR